jgi:hypothetical protein
MNIRVTRRWRIPASPDDEAQTKGDLLGDWGLKAHSLEDEVRVDPDPSTPANEGKVYGRTAVPAGTYDLYLAYSPHFKRKTAHFNAPGFTFTMIHGANRAGQLLGCIAAGRRLEPFGDCAAVVDEIEAQLRLAEQRGEAATITIEDAFEDPPKSNSGEVTG